MDWGGNLTDPEQIQKLKVFLSDVQIVPEVDPHIPCPIDLQGKDQPVFMTAISIQADYFMTGNITQLREYFGKSFREVKNCGPRDDLNMRKKKMEKSDSHEGPRAS